MNTYVFEEFCRIEWLRKEEMSMYKEYLAEHLDAKIKEDHVYEDRIIYGLYDWYVIWECEADSRHKAIKKYLETNKELNLNRVRVRKV